MEWITSSEAEVWVRLYNKHKEQSVTAKEVRGEVKSKALKKKLYQLVKKGWVVRVNRGRYYIPKFDEIMGWKMITLNTLEDVRENRWDIPLVVGSPANSGMYWYPMKKPQSLYAYGKHHLLIKTKYTLKPLKKEMFKRSVDIDGVRMLSLEDTIVESLLDADVQAAMAMAHRLKEVVDWSYLIKRIREERVEGLAYVSLEKFPQANELKKYYTEDFPLLPDSFIKKVLKENTVYAMRHN